MTRPVLPMRRIELAELTAGAAEFDRVAQAAPDVDAFCSSSAWIVSAHQAFHPEQEPWIWHDGQSWLVLAHAVSPDIGRYLAPMEAMWGLASPLISAAPAAFSFRCVEALRQVEDTWDALWLCGLKPRSEAFNTLAFCLGQHYRLFMGPTTRRHVASLEGGWDGFLARRRRTFRKSLRQATARAEAAGVTWEWHDRRIDEATRVACYQRALAVDDLSWKGLSRQGLSVGGMARFYDLMTAQLARNEQLRIVFGRLDGEDIAMGFGAAFGDTFRGLQMSFDDRFRELSLGNLVQARLIQRLAAEGCAGYDLGTEMAYKGRWSEPGLETVALVVRR